MELSLFLAKLLGLYFLIIAADLLFRRHQLEATVAEVFASRALLAFSGSISVLLGLALVIAHPVYEANWSGGSSACHHTGRSTSRGSC